MQLEQQLQQLDEQRQHVAAQLEQLAGLESGQDQLGVSDLQQQLKVCWYQRNHITAMAYVPKGLQVLNPHQPCLHVIPLTPVCCIIHRHR